MRQIRFVFSVSLLLTVFLISPALASVKPEMDSDDVYLISSAPELAWFRDRINAGDTEINARLTRDIDLGRHPWTPIGETQKDAFNGVFDGHGFYVRGLYVTGKHKHAGLFGCVGYSGMVQSLSIEGARVALRGVSEDLNAGVLCGLNLGVIQDCYVMRSALAVDDGEDSEAMVNAGVLTGRNDEGIILNSSAMQCNIYAKLYHSASRTLAVGGIAGMNVGTLPGMGLIQNSSAVDNCIVTEVRAHDANAYAGGIIGFALSGMARRCSVMAGSLYNDHFDGSSAAIGGIIGSSMLGSYLEDCKVGTKLNIQVRGGSVESSAGGIAGSLIGSNVEGCKVERVTVHADGNLPHSLGGLVGTFTGGRITSCYVIAANVPEPASVPYHVGAVAGVTFEIEIVDSKPETRIENTYFERDIAGGRAVGSDSNPAHTDAIPFRKDEVPACPIDVPLTGDSVIDVD